MPYLGEIFAFTTAVVWAFAVILFKKSGEKVHPVALNLFKNFLGFSLMIPTLWIFGETTFRDVPVWHYLLLILSGVIGIGIADTLFFMALNRLGAGLSSIVSCFYSPSIIFLSVFFLGERISLIQFIGVIMIISAILFATKFKPGANLTKRDYLIGFLIAIIANCLMAAGVVMIKPLLNHSPLLWATEIRLFGGFIFLIPYLVFHPKRVKIVNSLIKTHSWGYTISGSFVGAYLAMLLWLAGMKFTQASMAAALNQTSNIFVFILAAIFLREKIDFRRSLAIITAVSGALLVTFG